MESEILLLFLKSVLRIKINKKTNIIKPQLIYGRILSIHSILEMNLLFEQVPNDTLFE